MGFFLFLLYLMLSYVYPGEIFPALAPYRITFWVGIAGLIFAAGSSAIANSFRKKLPVRTHQLARLARSRWATG